MSVSYKGLEFPTELLARWAAFLTLLAGNGIQIFPLYPTGSLISKSLFLAAIRSVLAATRSSSLFYQFLLLTLSTGILLSDSLIICRMNLASGWQTAVLSSEIIQMQHTGT